jgi:hypothetical protein
VLKCALFSFLIWRLDNKCILCKQFHHERIGIPANYKYQNIDHTIFYSNRLYSLHKKLLLSSRNRPCFEFSKCEPRAQAFVRRIGPCQKHAQIMNNLSVIEYLPSFLSNILYYYWQAVMPLWIFQLTLTQSTIVAVYITYYLTAFMLWRHFWGSFSYRGISSSKIGLSAPSLERAQLRLKARVFLYT